jgi:hypothetical protein
VTESEWLACTDPQKMLDSLRGKVSDRKLRLFACACCRRVWPLLREPESQEVVRTSERYADGRVGPEELRAARAAVLAAAPAQWKDIRWAARAAAEAAGDDAAGAAATASCWVERAAVELAPLLQPPQRAGLVDKVGAAARAGLVRDIFGNPFRLTAADPEWLADAGRACRWHAGRAYKRRRRFGELDLERLAELADALEAAGCPEPEVLDHLRGPGPHVRGCWALDLLLGKE